jgi:hypothetical protein
MPEAEPPPPFYLIVMAAGREARNHQRRIECRPVRTVTRWLRSSARRTSWPACHPAA